MESIVIPIVISIEPWLLRVFENEGMNRRVVPMVCGNCPDKKGVPRMEEGVPFGGTNTFSRCGTRTM